MANNSTIISIDEIRSILKENCKEENKKFDEKEFKKFIEFLEIDFYDWVKENLKQFGNQ
jgi:hypothetical protein